MKVWLNHVIISAGAPDKPRTGSPSGVRAVPSGVWVHCGGLSWPMLGEEMGAAVVGACSLSRVLAHCSSNEPIPTQALFIRHCSNFRAYYLSFFLLALRSRFKRLNECVVRDVETSKTTQ